MVASKTVKPPKDARQEKRSATQPQKPPPVAKSQMRYRSDGQVMLLNIALLQSAVIAAAVGVLVYFKIFAPSDIRYFAATSTGQIIPMAPLDRPVDTDPVVLGWAAQAVSEVMTFNFKDYEERINRAQAYFTPKGWDSFVLGLKEAGYINTVVSNLQAQSAVPKEAPRVINRCAGSCNPYFWDIQMPLLINVESLDKKASNNRIITLHIIRVPPTENPAGIQIDDWKEE